jgi:hypothetical protein
MTKETTRDLIAEADRLKRWSQEAEFARTLIRLWERPKMRKGLLGFFGRSSGYEDVQFNQAQTDAIYQALARVRDDYARQAEEIERRIPAPEPTS